MKNDTSKTNYLSAAKTSQYDALQRQLSILIQHWMDHTSKLNESRLIPLLCDYIENAQLAHFKCDQADIFSTKSDHFLGRIIQFFIEIQDGEINNEELAEKRLELDKILNKFSILNHKKIATPGINLQSINQEKENSLPNTANVETVKNKQMKINWWIKLLSIFNKHS